MNFEDYESLPTTSVQSHMLAGAAAGVMEHCVMYPLDSVKTRMQSLTTTTAHGRGMGEIFRVMVAQEGVLRPLRGVNAVILGAAPAHALYFSCYEYLKDTINNKTFVNNNVGYGLAGGIATMLHDGIMTPADVVKQRLQMYNSPYKSVLECIRKVYYQEGMVSFYRSYSTQLAMNVPFQSIHFITYEIMQGVSNPSRTYNPMAHMISGAISGGVAAAITTPLDVCKTFLNTQQTQEKISGLFNAIRSVYKLGGPLGFFRGLQARVLYQMPSTAICWSTYELFKYLLSVNIIPTDEILTQNDESPSIVPHPSPSEKQPTPSDKHFVTLSPPDSKSITVTTKFIESDNWSGASTTRSGGPYKTALAYSTVHSGESSESFNSRLLDSSRDVPMENTGFRRL